jgi:hypothetical protein
MTLLAIIVLAPTIQFFGDRLKDKADEASQADTAKKIETDVGTSITAATTKSAAEIVQTAKDNQKGIQDTFKAADKQQKDSSRIILRQETELGARTESILTQTERALETIHGLMFSAEIVLPGNNDDVKQFTASLEQAIARLKTTVIPGDSGSKEGLTFFFRDAAHLDAVEVDRHSVHYPRDGSEPLSDAISYGFGVSFEEPSLNPSEDPAGLLASPGPEGRRLMYWLGTHQLVVEYSRSNSDPRYWRRSPNFASVADIRRSLIRFAVQHNVDRTSDRSRRSLAILQGAVFKSFGFSTPDGVSYWSSRIYRLQPDDYGVFAFGGKFEKLFNMTGRELVFADPSNPAIEVQDNLEAAVLKFEQYLAQFGIRSLGEYKVSIGSSDSDFSDGMGEIRLPPDISAMPVHLLWAVSDILIHSDTDLSEQLSTYLVCDFLGNPRQSLTGKTLDISSTGPRSGETYQNLSSALWEIRRTIGPKSTNALITMALARFRANRNSGDSLSAFARLLARGASPATAQQVSRALLEHALP